MGDSIPSERLITSNDDAIQALPATNYSPDTSTHDDDHEATFHIRGVMVNRISVSEPLWTTRLKKRPTRAKTHKARPSVFASQSISDVSNVGWYSDSDPKLAFWRSY